MKQSTFFVVVFALLCFFTTAMWGQTNYQFTSTVGSVTIATTGTAFTWTTTIANDDEYSTAVNIFAGGETFTYAGTGFTQFQASTNGFIRLGTTLASATPLDALSGTLRSIIAPLWDDLAVSATATDVFYNISGSTPDQVLAVTWRNVKWNKTALAANAEFQIKLHETTNVIEFEYGTMGTPTAGAASIGLADNTVITSAGSAVGRFLSINIGGTAGSRVYHQTMGLPFNTINAAPDNNTVFTFTPATPSPLAGGTYTVGGASPNYTTLSQAAMALNINGVAGPVTLSIRSGPYDDIIHLLAIAGASSTNTITFQKESGTVTLSPHNGSYSTTAPGVTSGDAIIRLDGAQYVTVDGLVLNDNADNATTATKFDAGIFLATSHLNGAVTSGARFNTIKNCSIDMKVTNGSPNNGAVCIRLGTFNSTESDPTKANSFNTIQDVTLTGFWRSCIRMFGTSGTNPDLGNTVTAVLGRNTVGNVNITSGTALDIRAFELDCQSNLNIEKTDITNITTTVSTTNNIYGIWLNPGASATNLNSGTIIIRNCTISYLSNSGLGVTTGFAAGIASNNVANNTEIQVYNNKIYNLYTTGDSTCRATAIGIFFSTGTPTTAKIYNNFVCDLKAPRSTSAPGVRGLDLQNAAGGASFSVYNNTVYLDNSVPPAIVRTNYGHRSTCATWGNVGTASLDLRNNLFVNLMGNSSTGTGVSIATCLYPTSSANLLRLASTTDNNLYFVGVGSANRGIAYDAATVYQTLATYQAAVASGGLGGPRDVNAISVDATTAFVSSVSPYDLHISTSNWIVNGQGKPTTLVTTDIDGDARSTLLANGPVDIGADEYTPTGSAATTQSGAITDLGTTTFTGVDNKTVAVINWRAGTGRLPSSVTLTYAPGAQAASPGIFRKFTIIDGGSDPGWNADMSLYYNSSTELRGFTESSMRINQNSGSGWNVLPTTISTTNHSGTATVTAFSDFGLDNGTDPLPIQLGSFTGAAISNTAVRLDWMTLSEINNFGFYVQRRHSTEPAFTELPNSFVPGHGTTLIPQYYTFTDNTAAAGRWFYRLKQVDLNGTTTLTDPIQVDVLTEVSDLVPKEFSLSQNFPNPFNPETNIKFSVETAGRAKLEIYNILGQKVATLFDDVAETGREYIVKFNGLGMTSGVYFYTLESGQKKDLKKMLLLK